MKPNIVIYYNFTVLLSSQNETSYLIDGINTQKGSFTSYRKESI